MSCIQKIASVPGKHWVYDLRPSDCTIDEFSAQTRDGADIRLRVHCRVCIVDPLLYIRSGKETSRVPVEEYCRDSIEALLCGYIAQCVSRDIVTDILSKLESSKSGPRRTTEQTWCTHIDRKVRKSRGFSVSSLTLQTIQFATGT